MNTLIFLSLISVALGQFGPFHNHMLWGSSGDRIHEFHFIYHDDNHLLLIRNMDSCWLVEISDDLRTLMHDQQTRERIEDELYQQILLHNGETPGNHEEIRDKYNDRMDYFMCMRHKTYHLIYEPEPKTSVAIEEIETTEATQP